MNNEIKITKRVTDGVDFTCVTQDDSEVLRALVVIPFDSRSITEYATPCELPHLLEHLVLSGDDSRQNSDFKDSQEALGGYYNGHTQSTINGLVGFETTQPDTGASQVRDLVHTITSPALRASDVAEQRVIVRNELNGYLQNPVRQRSSLMDYTQGTLYKTDQLGIDSLDHITPDHLLRFHQNYFTPGNMRLVLTGAPDTVHDLAEQLAADIVASTNKAQDQRYVSANSDIQNRPDYHAPAAEIPDGMTAFRYMHVYEGDVTAGFTTPEFQVVAGAFYDYLYNGTHGISERSRSSGLSYGIRMGWQYGPRQISLSVADTTAASHVRAETDMLADALARVADFDASHFEHFRMKSIGQQKMHPINLIKFASNVEQMVGNDELAAISTPQDYRRTLAEVDPSIVVDGVKTIAAHLETPTFIQRQAFGDNPFAA